MFRFSRCSFLVIYVMRFVSSVLLISCAHVDMSLVGTPLGKWLQKWLTSAVNCNRLDVKEMYCEDMYCFELIGVTVSW